MTPSVVGAVDGSVQEVTSVQVQRPAGTQAGDLLICSAYVEAATAALAGWDEEIQLDAQTWRHFVWVREDDGSPGPWTIDWGGALRWVDWMTVAIRDAAGINARGGQVNPESESLTAPSITTTVDGCLLVMLGTVDGPATATPPPGMVEVSDDSACWAGEEPQAAAGPTGPRTATLSEAWASTGIMLALAPVPSGPTVWLYDGVEMVRCAIRSPGGP